MTCKNDLSSPVTQLKKNSRLSTSKASVSQRSAREQLMSSGPEMLDHTSLIAIILGISNSSEQEALHLSRRVLKHLGSLRQFTRIRLDQLLLIRGIGPAKACRLMAVAEIARRIMSISKNQYENNNSCGLHYLQQLGHLIRCSNQQTQPLLVASQIDPQLNTTSTDFNEAMQFTGALKESLDLATTLSLSATLTDLEQHSRWLAKLLLNEIEQNEVAWTIISYRLDEDLSQSEINSVNHFFDLAITMGVAIQEVILVSPDHEWSLSPSSLKE